MTMYAHGTAGRLPRLALVLTLTAAIGGPLTACSGGGGTVTQHTSATPPAPASAAAAPAATTSAPAPAAAASGLSGKWLGHYTGSYQGTFTLHWRQSGPKLKGTIDISSPASTMPIHGSVSGGKISFGTVGQYGITYSGTVSGNSMSGTYQVKDGRGSTGNWSAARS